jgi:hypothetical protein
VIESFPLDDTPRFGSDDGGGNDNDDALRHTRTPLLLFTTASVVVHHRADDNGSSGSIVCCPVYGGEFPRHPPMLFPLAAAAQSEYRWLRALK